MQIRDRIKELRRVKAADLTPNPRNWRKHPQRQQDALRGVLAEVGYADALLVRELDDGALELIDGHLRAETTPDQLVPVLVLDVTAEEAAKILATHDPLAALAEADTEKLDALLRDLHFDNDAVADMLLDVSDSARSAHAEENSSSAARDAELIESYQVVVQCDCEQTQQDVYQRMTAEGYQCRILTL
jgi:hypothetical protein